MSTGERSVWICEFPDCGHVWLKTGDVPPAQCSKCKRRGWHTAAAASPQALAMAVSGPVFVDAQGEAVPAVPAVTIAQPATARPPMPTRPAPRHVPAVAKACPECGSLSGLHQRWCGKGN